MIVSPAVALNTNALDRQENREGLPDLVVDAFVVKRLDEDLVDLAENLKPLGRDLADNPDRKPRSRKGVPLEKSLGHFQMTTHRPDLVLEKLAKRLDQAKWQPLGKPAYIVVRLDRG